MLLRAALRPRPRSLWTASVTQWGGVRRCAGVRGGGHVEQLSRSKAAWRPLVDGWVQDFNAHLAARGAASISAKGPGDLPKKEKKRPEGLIAWLWDQVLHIYHGFRLLAVNVGVTLRLRRQMTKGQKMTRRERQLLETTTKDLLRLVPFSLFIIIPGAELLLPVALAMFPNLMPSTFDTTDGRRRRHIMENLTSGVARRRLFEHMTLRIIVHEHFAGESESLTTFRACFDGDPVTERAIRKFVPYFEDEGPLALMKLPFYVLGDLSVLSGMVTRKRLRLESVFLPRTWVEARLRYLLDQHLQSTEEDDRCLAQSDLSKMTFQELEQECARRKMRWIGPPEALRKQLEQWLSLSLDPDVPNHLLLFLFPRATESDVMLKCLSKDEQEHILGLTRFRDGPLYIFLKDVTARAQKTSQSEIQASMMEQDIDEMKEHIKELSEEDAATAEVFAELREALRSTTDEELVEYYDTLACSTSIEVCNLEGDMGVDAMELGKALADLLQWKGVEMSADTLTRALHEFELDETDVVTVEDFQSIVKRIRKEK